MESYPIDNSLDQCHEAFPLFFFFLGVLVLGLTFKPFELRFVNDVRQGSAFMILNYFHILHISDIIQHLSCRLISL